VFELWPTARSPPKPTGQLGIQYVTGAAWAWAVRPPRQSAANTNARPNLLEKIDIRATAKCPETIRSRYQERQCGATGRRITKDDRITECCVIAPFAHSTGWAGEQTAMPVDLKVMAGWEDDYRVARRYAGGCHSARKPNELPSLHLISPRYISTLRWAIFRKGPSSRTSGMGGHSRRCGDVRCWRKADVNVDPGSRGPPVRRGAAV
jgi:hypothetical protein